MRALTYSTETVIRRSPEDVFDYCSDLRSELEWNPKVKYIEVVRFDRPRSWETTTRARGMVIRFQGTVADAAPGARYTASLELHPRRLAWLVAPLALLAMRRQDQHNMRRIREALESSAVTRSAER
jgi:hypothetical protein